jgi:hypothetical protein
MNVNPFSRDVIWGALPRDPSRAFPSELSIAACRLTEAACAPISMFRTAGET